MKKLVQYTVYANERLSLLDLPEELLMVIFSYLGSLRGLASINGTCRKFRRIAQDPLLRFDLGYSVWGFSHMRISSGGVHTGQRLLKWRDFRAQQGDNKETSRLVDIASKIEFSRELTQHETELFQSYRHIPIVAYYCAILEINSLEPLINSKGKISAKTRKTFQNTDFAIPSHIKALLDTAANANIVQTHILRALLKVRIANFYFFALNQYAGGNPGDDIHSLYEAVYQDFIKFYNTVIRETSSVLDAPAPPPLPDTMQEFIDTIFTNITIQSNSVAQVKSAYVALFKLLTPQLPFLLKKISFDTLLKMNIEQFGKLNCMIHPRESHNSHQVKLYYYQTWVTTYYPLALLSERLEFPYEKYVHDIKSSETQRTLIRLFNESNLFTSDKKRNLIQEILTLLMPQKVREQKWLTPDNEIRPLIACFTEPHLLERIKDNAGFFKGIFDLKLSQAWMQKFKKLRPGRLFLTDNSAEKLIDSFRKMRITVLQSDPILQVFAKAWEIETNKMEPILSILLFSYTDLQDGNLVPKKTTARSCQTKIEKNLLSYLTKAILNTNVQPDNSELFFSALLKKGGLTLFNLRADELKEQGILPECWNLGELYNDFLLNEDRLNKIKRQNMIGRKKLSSFPLTSQAASCQYPFFQSRTTTATTTTATTTTATTTTATTTTVAAVAPAYLQPAEPDLQNMEIETTSTHTGNPQNNQNEVWGYEPSQMEIANTSGEIPFDPDTFWNIMSDSEDNDIGSPSDQGNSFGL